MIRQSPIFPLRFHACCSIENRHDPHTGYTPQPNPKLEIRNPKETEKKEKVKCAFAKS